MQEREQAEEHLRVIRSLMERATVYRAISAPSALIGGLLTVARDAALAMRGANEGHTVTLAWMGLCAVQLAVNGWFLSRDASRRGEPFFSTGMKVALRSVLPSFLLAALATALLVEYPATLYVLWCLCYGLGLLAAAHFAPRSLGLLGRAFWVAGMGGVLILARTIHEPALSPVVQFVMSHFMGLTFGLFHLVYAACVWPRRLANVVTFEPPSADA
jgi:hypothetical protein